MQNALVGEEIKDLIINFGKPHKLVFHMRRFQGGLAANLQMMELTHLFSELVVVVQHLPIKQRTLVFH